MMEERLGLAVIPGTGWSVREIETIAREAEDAGFDAIFTTEVNNDAMATAQVMGRATRRIQVGTWTANIYLRHSYVCAQGASLIADATGGRFLLGLGVSHQPVNRALNIEMPRPLQTLRRYVMDVRQWLRGDGPATHLPQRPASHRVPIYIATLGARAVELAGEIAEGMMPALWPATRVAASKAWASRGGVRAQGLGPLHISLGVPTFPGHDVDAAREAARQNLALYTGLPFFQRMFRHSGFADEATQMEHAAGPASLTDRLLDAICLLGPAERCREQLATFRRAGVELPILYPAVGVEAARAAIHAFRR